MPCRVLGAPVPGRGCSRGAAAQVHPGPLAGGRGRRGAPQRGHPSPPSPPPLPGPPSPRARPAPRSPDPAGPQGPAGDHVPVRPPQAAVGSGPPRGATDGASPWSPHRPGGRARARAPPELSPGPRSDAASVGCGWHPGFLGGLGSRDAEETHALAAVCWGRRKQNTMDRWLLSAWNPFSLSGGWKSKVTARVEPVSRESRAGRVRVPAGQPLTRLSVARAEGARRVSSIGALTPFTGAPSP